MTNYTVGQSVIIEGTFRDEDGDLANPGVVTLSLRAPDGSMTNPAPVSNVSTGIYEATVVLDQAGIWRWQWEGTTGAIIAIAEGAVCAERSIVFVGGGSS